MATITYTGDHTAHTVPIGPNRAVKREGACEDIALERAVAVDCPLVVTIVIRTTGAVALFSTRWQIGHENTYWHFAMGTDESHALTEAQRTTLELMWLGRKALPGNLRSALGQPVAAWAFHGSSPDEVAVKHGAPRPILNG